MGIGIKMSGGGGTKVYVDGTEQKYKKVYLNWHSFYVETSTFAIPGTGWYAYNIDNLLYFVKDGEEVKTSDGINIETFASNPSCRNPYLFKFKDNYYCMYNHSTGTPQSIALKRLQGDSWTQVTTFYCRGRLSFCATDTFVLAFGGSLDYDTKCYKSTNGTSYRSMSNLPEGTGAGCGHCVFNNEIYYVGESQGLYKTSSGSSWTKVTSVPDVSSYSCLFVYRGDLFYWAELGLYMLNGTTWTKVATFTTTSSAYYVTFFVMNDRLYFLDRETGKVKELKMIYTIQTQ